MDAVHAIVLIAHFLGAAGILVGTIGTWLGGPAPLFAVALWSARVQVLTGLVLAGIAFADDEANVLKLIVKLVVALAVAGIIESSAGKAQRRNPMAIAAILTFANAAIASSWN